MKRIAAGLLACTLLAACSNEPPPAPAVAPDHAVDRAIQEPLDKARAVEDAMMKAKQEQDATIEEQGG